MGPGVGGPAEPEEANGDAEGADEGGGKALFGLEFTGGVELGFDDFVEVEEKWGDDEDGANEDTDEGETFLAEVEAVDVYEDNGERFEPYVEEAVDEGYVEV